MELLVTFEDDSSDSRLLKQFANHRGICISEFLFNFAIAPEFKNLCFDALVSCLAGLGSLTIERGLVDISVS